MREFLWMCAGLLLLIALWLWVVSDCDKKTCKSGKEPRWISHAGCICIEAPE